MDGQPLHIVWGDAAGLQRESEREAPFLSDAEHARLQAIRSPGRHRQFVAARWLARRLLAQVHGGTPHDWPLGAGLDGPPQVLAAKGRPIHLALSHSHDVIACALAATPVGIDIESPRRARDVMALAQIACDDAERALLQARPQAERAPFFYELWTAKEAWIKRWAHAMAPQRLARIHLRPAPQFDAAPVRVWRGMDWTLAVATPAGLPVRWHAPVPAERSAWNVEDDGAPVNRPA